MRVKKDLRVAVRRVERRRARRVEVAAREGQGMRVWRVRTSEEWWERFYR